MRTFDDCRVACFIVSDPCGSGDAMTTPLAKIVFIICGDDEYTAMAWRGRVSCRLVPLVLLAFLLGDAAIVVEECLDRPLPECAFAPWGYLPL